MAGYIRQSVAEIVADAVVLAQPINNEFNSLQSAFHATTGHAHDGTIGSGPRINLTTSVSGQLPIANGGTGANTTAGVFDNVKQDATTSYKGVTELATSAEFRANTAGNISLTPEQVWASAAEVTLTDSATITPDMSTFINAKLILGGNRTLANPTNAKPGQSGYIRIIQDGTGSRTLAYGSNWKFQGGVKPVLTTTANAEDILVFVVLESNRIYGILNKDVK